MAQCLRTWLGSMRMHIRSLASLSGLRTWHCCELWYRSQTSSDPTLLWLWCRPAAIADWTPSPGTSICHRCSLKKKKIKKKKERKEKKRKCLAAENLARAISCRPWGRCSPHWLPGQCFFHLPGPGGPLASLSFSELPAHLASHLEA